LKSFANILKVKGFSLFWMTFGNRICALIISWKFSQLTVSVLTSRNFEVASLATSNCTIKLEPLEENNSWELFCKVAFRNNDDKRCPSELQDLGAKFLQKCEGLPIAIACVGHLLSFKPTTYPEWEAVYKELELRSANNAIRSVDNILKVSLEDLPYELKNCFLHCAMFPEDSNTKWLITDWIASGFIKEKEKKQLNKWQRAI